MAPAAAHSPSAPGSPDATRDGQLRLRAVVLAGAAIALGVAAYRVQVENASPHSWALASVAVGWTFAVAGLVAWLSRPANRLGPLLLAAGLAYLARQLRYSGDAVLFTVFFLFGDLCFALVGHAILAYPSGRVEGRWPRRLMVAGYATVLGFPLAVLLLHGATQPLFSMGLSHRSLLLVSDRAHAVYVLQRAQVVIFYGVLASLFIVVIGWRLATASPRARRMLAPLLLAAVALGLRATYECVRTFTNQPLGYRYLFWWQVVAFVALPFALLAGMLRARLARASVSELVLALDQAPATPQTLRDALARALADPSLELYFWLPDQRDFVDAAGAVVSLPPEDGERSVTTLEHNGELLAAIVCDASLLDEPVLLGAAGAAVRLALENARLHAQTRAQLRQVRESRRRIASAADDERRRIERNLHDGAQNRLLALALELSAAQRRLGSSADPEVERLLAASVEELQSTVEELRTLARGLHPTVLTEYGLAAALEALTHRLPLPVALDVFKERLPAQAEATAYFVAAEALSNVVKHAHAETASIEAQHTGDWLVIEIGDDGAGGARAGGGSGLRGIADRVEALGGRLQIDSDSSGTRVKAEIPCVS
jgi:signal transduction histidine kinase